MSRARLLLHGGERCRRLRCSFPPVARPPPPPGPSPAAPVARRALRAQPACNSPGAQPNPQRAPTPLDGADGSAWRSDNKPQWLHCIRTSYWAGNRMGGGRMGLRASSHRPARPSRGKSEMVVDVDGSTRPTQRGLGWTRKAPLKPWPNVRRGVTGRVVPPLVRTNGILLNAAHRPRRRVIDHRGRLLWEKHRRTTLLTRGPELSPKHVPTCRHAKSGEAVHHVVSHGIMCTQSMTLSMITVPSRRMRDQM